MIAKLNPATTAAVVLFTAAAGRKPELSLNIANVTDTAANFTIGVVQAKDRSIASITVTTGGQYASLPSVSVATTGTAPSTAAVLAAPLMGLFNAPITAAGTGYAANQVLSLVGGTNTVVATITINAVGGSGEVTAATVTNVGNYSVLPANPAAVTGGSGTGATFSPTWKILSVAATTAGNGYDDSAGITTIITTGGSPTTTATLTPVFGVLFEEALDTYHPKTNLLGRGVIERTGITMDAGDALVVVSGTANAINYMLMGYNDLA